MGHVPTGKTLIRRTVGTDQTATIDAGNHIAVSTVVTTMTTDQTMPELVAWAIRRIGTGRTGFAANLVVASLRDVRISTLITGAIRIIHTSAVSPHIPLAGATLLPILLTGPLRQWILTIGVLVARTAAVHATAESIHAPGTSTGGLGQNDHIVAVVTTGALLSSSTIHTAEVARRTGRIDQTVIGVILTFGGLASVVLTGSAEGSSPINDALTGLHDTGFTVFTVGIRDTKTLFANALVAGPAKDTIAVILAALFTLRCDLVAQLVVGAIRVQRTTAGKHAHAQLHVAHALDGLTILFLCGAIVVVQATAAQLTVVL